MYVSLEPRKDGRPIRGFCRTILGDEDMATLGVKIGAEIITMMENYKKYHVPYDAIIVAPCKKPTKNDYKMHNVQVPQNNSKR